MPSSPASTTSQPSPSIAPAQGPQPARPAAGPPAPPSDFDLVRERRGTASLKWDFAAQRSRPESALPLWLASHGLEDMDVVDATKDTRVRAALERAVARTNEAVSRAESIRTFTILPTDFTVANGLLTPSLKVKRDEAQRRFAAQIDELYTRLPQR